VNPEDRACSNCEALRLVKVPNIGATSDADYKGYAQCRQKLSDHFRHLLSLDHLCAWHSDSIKNDKRYPLWRESIDKEQNERDKV